MATGACMQHGRRAEAGKRVEARLQKEDSGREAGSSAGGAMIRKRALEGDVSTRAAACWAAERRKWRRVRACSMAGGLRRGNACRQGFRGQIKAGERAQALAGR